MRRHVFGGAVLVALGLTGVLAAQDPPTQQQTPPAQQSAAAAQTVTIEGCLFREKDVPGRQPNVAERAGVKEDYILTNATLKGPQHTPPDPNYPPTTPPPTGTAGAATGQPTGTSGMFAGPMYEVRGLDESQLKEFVGQRVEIEGKIDPKDLPERAREAAKPAGEPAGDLPEFQAVTIKKAAVGTCPPVK